MSTDTNMVHYYAERAHEYERIYQKPERQADLRQLRDLVEHAFAGANVLEIACGTGYWTEIIARRAVSILATDINEEVLNIARSKAIPSHTTRFQKQSAYDLGQIAREHTAGFSGFWWSHVPKARLQEFLREWHSHLTNGATVVVIDNRYVEGSSTPLSRTDDCGNTYQNRVLEDGSVHEVLKNFPEEPELRAELQRVAVDVEITLLPFYWYLTYKVHRPSAE